LLCGDATIPADVGKVLNGEAPFICVTDPPYGVKYDPQWRQDAAEAGHLSKANRATGTVSNDDRADWSEAYMLFPGKVLYAWSASSASIESGAAIKKAGFEIRSMIIWKKPHFAISRGHYHFQHEPCWYAAKGSSKWCGDRSQSTIWECSSRIQNHTEHGTEKPLEIMARPIRNHGDASDHVYDPFVGSGTTIIAAEKLGRRCFAIELDAKYVDVCCQRFVNETGEQPVRESDGELFANITPSEAEDGDAEAEE
jgi:DNA modification methylase